jgi:diguanylate cyclase (GGDEF)-like protein/PAS domain S-box-containing protein
MTNAVWSIPWREADAGHARGPKRKGPESARQWVERYAWAGYLVFGAALVAAYMWMPGVRHNGLLFSFISLSAAAAIAVGVRRNRPSSRAPWFLLIAAQLLYVTGDLSYFGYEALFHHVPSFPSLNDVFYLAFYPTAMAGLLVLVRRRSPEGNLNSLIDALIVTIGLALFSWVFLIAPYFHDPSLTIVQKAVSIAYPSMDVGILAVAVRLAVDGGASKRSLRMLLLGVVALLATDAVYGLVELSGGFDPGGLLEVGWASFYLLWGAAALHPSMRDLDRPIARSNQTLTWARLALLTAASLMAPAVLAIQVLRGHARAEAVIIASTVALFVLVIARMAGLVRDREHAAARERALREAARDLVSAVSRDDVLDAALPSLRALAGEDRHVRVAELGPSGDARVWMHDTAGPTHWPADTSHLAPADAALLRAHGVLTVDLGDARLRAVLRLPTDATHGLAFPLLVREQLRGLVLVAGGDDFTGDLHDTLQTMAVQISLALEGAILAETVHTRRSEQRFRSLVQHSSDLITVIDADTTIAYVSPSVQRVLGYDSDDLIGRRVYELMHPHDRDRVVALLADSAAEDSQAAAAEARLRNAGGAWQHFEILHTNLLADPNVSGIVLNARDVSERKAFEAQLRQLAFRDPVTSLANRALFTDRVDHALARLTRDSGGLAVIFADLDDFKVINDSLGHAAGDTLLAQVGQRLRGCVRTMDTVARFGGDEFAILIEDTTRITDVAGVADKILDALTAPFVIDGNEVYIGASMGIAMIDDDAALTASADDLLRNADVAMYIAKRQNPGHYRIFEPDMHTNLLDRLELKGALQRAIERDELDLHYQPVVSLDDGHIRGFEALVRWHHPDRGLVPPAEFIPIAEETGLIGALGRWVLHHAFRHGRLLQQAVPQTPPLRINVNVSVRQLNQPSLVTEVADALAASGIDPATVTLEITESVLVNDSETTINRLRDLKRLGVQLAIDDFGTGYSSLSYLSKFPVDILKIDRSFINRLTDGTDDSALAAAIVRIGETLNLHTVAEGIERPDQLDALRRMNCDSGQGYHFARPMPLDETLDYLGATFAATPAAD